MSAPSIVTDMIQGSAMDTCRECPAPITQPLGRGRQRVFCAACIARHKAQLDAKRYAELAAERIAAATTTCQVCPAPITQNGRGRRTVFCPECALMRFARSRREQHAALSPADLAAKNQARREYRDAWTPEQREAKVQADRVRHAEQYAALSPEGLAAYAQAARERWLQGKYRMSIVEFDAMLAAQGGTCAVATCTRTGTDGGRALSVDHDHACCPGKSSCGKCVRWLLCHQHNTVLGLVNDDPAELRAAADLLESHARRTS